MDLVGDDANVGRERLRLLKLKCRLGIEREKVDQFARSVDFGLDNVFALNRSVSFLIKKFK